MRRGFKARAYRSEETSGLGASVIRDAVPTRRSSPPAEKWAVCIGPMGPSQGTRGRKLRGRNDIGAAEPRREKRFKRHALSGSYGPRLIHARLPGDATDTEPYCN